MSLKSNLNTFLLGLTWKVKKLNPFLTWSRLFLETFQKKEAYPGLLFSLLRQGALSTALGVIQELIYGALHRDFPTPFSIEKPNATFQSES